MKTIDAATFLSKVWPEKLLRYETLELRARNRKTGQVKHTFHTSIDEFLSAAKTYGKGWDIYFGVSTRFHQGGKKKDCYRVRCVWVDLDKAELPDFGDLPPDIIVNSGSGHHVYWLLNDPIFIRTGRWTEVEAVNRALQRKFGGDQMTIDVSRILRVPGFHNYKTDPPKKVQVHVFPK